MKEIGLILRKRREEKRLSLETVNHKTHIPLKFLIALEEGDPAAFPAEVYFTGSLRKYAGFLGLDPDQLVEKYRESTRRPEKEQAPPKEKEHLPESGLRAVAAGAVLVLILLAALLAFFINRSRQPGAPDPAAQWGVPPSTSTAAAEAPPRPSTSTAQAPRPSTSTVPVPKRIPPKPAAPPGVSTTTAQAAQPRTEQLTLQVRTTQASWTKVTADDAVVFQGTLGPGETRAWTARERFHLVVGYAPAVSATLNGRPVDVRTPAVQDVAELDLGWKDIAGSQGQ